MSVNVCLFHTWVTINCRTDRFLDSYMYVGRMEIAMIVGLVQGHSPTHMCMANQMRPWSNVAFSIFTRNISIWRLQFLDKVINFRTVLIIGVHKQSQIESGLQGCLFVALPYRASQHWPQTTLSVLNSSYLPHLKTEIKVPLSFLWHFQDKHCLDFITLCACAGIK